ncbi:hypothetical protein D3C83_18570 [compost metagenome]
MRGARSPKITAPSSCKPCSSRARSFSACAPTSAMRPAASSHAAPKPTIAGTFSVPERRPCSWPPPAMSGRNSSRLSTTSAAAPFGP